MCSRCYVFNALITEFLYSVFMSIMNSNTDFATVLALLSSIGMATRFFIKSQISVTAFLFSRSYLGNGPIVSTNTLSNTYKGVCIIVKGVFVCFVISACLAFSTFLNMVCNVTRYVHLVLDRYVI